MPTRTITISQSDLDSIERVLSRLSASDGEVAADSETISPASLLRIARSSLEIRKRRAQFLHPSMFGEPAYDMLLGLYVAEADETSVTAARLAELSEVPQSSALRWIDYLVDKKLVGREPHPADKRATVLRLSNEGRTTLESLFSAMIIQLQEQAS